MGGEGEFWRDVNAARRKRELDAQAARARPLKSDLKRIRALGYDVRAMINPGYYRITGNGLTLDWWRSTDAWRDPRGSGLTSCGFRALFKRLRDHAKDGQ